MTAKIEKKNIDYDKDCLEKEFNQEEFEMNN
jgi:hypothetical protein